MKRKFLPLAVIAFSILIQTASGQTTTKPVRTVEKQTLISKIRPEIRLKFNNKFKFAGSQKFVLYERATAEQYFFVESENKKIARMYMLQFEGFSPDVGGSYDYNEPQKVTLGGAEYFSNSEYIPNISTALKAVPGSDIAQAADFLQKKGFILPGSLRYQRFVRTVDKERRKEFIVLYIEGTTAADPATKDAQLKALSGNAQKGFKVLK